MFAAAISVALASVAALVLAVAYQRAAPKLQRDLVWGAFVSVVTLASLALVVVLGCGVDLVPDTRHADRVPAARSEPLQERVP